MSASMKERFESICPFCKHGVELSGYVHIIGKTGDSHGLWFKCFAAEFLDLLPELEPLQKEAEAE